MTVAPPSYERHLRILGTLNLRDVGGYPTADGRLTRWRTLFRSDGLHRLPLESQTALLEHGLRQVIDLRWASELATQPNVFRDSPRVRYRNLPVFEDDPAARVDTLAATYRLMLDERGAQFAAVVRSLLDADGLPAVIHCAAGKDRTGVTIALILSALGVSVEAVVEDYAFTRSCVAIGWQEAGLEEEPLMTCPPELMQETLEHLERTHGGVRSYLLSAGLDEADLTALRERLTE